MAKLQELHPVDQIHPPFMSEHNGHSYHGHKTNMYRQLYLRTLILNDVILFNSFLQTLYEPAKIRTVKKTAGL